MLSFKNFRAFLPGFIGMLPLITHSPCCQADELKLIINNTPELAPTKPIEAKPVTMAELGKYISGFTDLQYLG